MHEKQRQFFETKRPIFSLLLAENSLVHQLKAVAVDLEAQKKTARSPLKWWIVPYRLRTTSVALSALLVIGS